METGIAPSELLREPEDNLNAMLFYLRWRSDPKLRKGTPRSNLSSLSQLDDLL